MNEKKKTNPFVFVGIGCLVLIVLIAIVSAIVGKFVASKIAGGAIEKAIEDKTGIKTNIEDLGQGKMKFTDDKTGATIDVGSGEMPENFPKDFPIYEGAKVTSSLTGGESREGSGFWLTLTTGDSVDEVSSFYKINLAANGWTETANYTSEGVQTQVIKKGTVEGTVAITRDEEAKETQIVVVLGEETNP